MGLSFPRPKLAPWQGFQKGIMSLSDLITKHINTKNIMTDTELLNIASNAVKNLTPAQKKRRKYLYQKNWVNKKRAAAQVETPQVSGPPHRPPGWLTSRTMVEKHPEEIKYLDETGTAKGLQERPELKELLLGRGEDIQSLYQALTYHRKKQGKVANGGRKDWTAEQYTLAREIMNDPTFTMPGGNTRWTLAFHLHPEWAQALDQDKVDKSSFLSFISRVRKGKGQSIVESKKESSNGHGIVIGGREYSVPELEQFINAQRNTVEPMRFCPHCGHNMQMFSKAYSIAKKHSGE